MSKLTTKDIPLNLIDHHPLNEVYFGNVVVDEEFCDELRRHGQKTTGLVHGPTPEGRYTMLSGHRRLEGLRAIGAETMRNDIEFVESELEQRAILITCNNQRAINNHHRISIATPLFKLTEAELKTEWERLNQRATENTSDYIEDKNFVAGAPRSELQTKYGVKPAYISAITGLSVNAVRSLWVLLDDDKWNSDVVKALKKEKVGKKAIEDANAERESLIAALLAEKIGVHRIPDEVRKLKQRLIENAKGVKALTKEPAPTRTPKEKTPFAVKWELPNEVSVMRVVLTDVEEGSEVVQYGVGFVEDETGERELVVEYNNPVQEVYNVAKLNMAKLFDLAKSALTA